MSQPRARQALLSLGLALLASCAPGLRLPWLGSPREPEAKWFRAYAGPLRPLSEVGVLCHRERATSVERLRRPGGPWVDGRHEPWHFPICLEVLPGRYELEVQYFRRDAADDADRAVTRQAESTEPCRVEWEALAGGLYELSSELGPRAPAAWPAPRRHIPRSRALGTSWWELETSTWSVRIDRLASWELAQPAARDARRAWERYERGRRPLR